MTTAAYPDRQSAAYSAKLALETRRNADAVSAMKFIALMESQLTVEERELLNSAYKNVMRDILSVRAALSAKLQKEENEVNVVRINEYIERLDTEMTQLCNDAKSILDDHVIPRASSHEDKVFYHMMKGDHFRFLAELKTGNERNQLANESWTAYRMADEIACGYLLCTNPLRLKLALKHAFLFHDILDLTPSALCILHKATLAAFSAPITAQVGECINVVEVLFGYINKWTNTLKSAHELGGANDCNGGGGGGRGRVDAGNIKEENKYCFKFWETRLV